MSALRRHLHVRSLPAFSAAAGLALGLGGAVAMALGSNPHPEPTGPTEPVTAAASVAGPSLAEASGMMLRGETADARAAFEAAFDRASAAGALSVATESAAWRTLLTPEADRVEMDRWSHNTALLASNVEMPPRLTALVETARVHAAFADGSPGRLAEALAGHTATTDDPAVRFFVELRLAHALRLSDQHAGALKHLETAEILARQDLGESSMVHTVRVDRAGVLQASGRPDQARDELRATLSTMRELAPLRATVLVQLAEREFHDADFVMAQSHFDEALELLERAPNPSTALVLRTLILVSEMQGLELKFEAAQATLERARVLAESTRGTQNRSLAVIHSETAALFETLGDTAQSLKHRRIALDMFERQGYVAEALGTRLELAGLYISDGDTVRASEHLATIAPEVLVSEDLMLRFVFESNLAEVAALENNHEAACHHFRAARRRLELVRGPEHPVVGMLLGNEAHEMSQLGERADEMFERAIAMQRDGGAPDFIYAFSQLWYAQHLWGLDERARAKSLFALAVPAARKHPGPPPELRDAEEWFAQRGVYVEG